MNATQNIDRTVPKPEGVRKAPTRLTKKQFKEKWRARFTQLHIEDQERKRNQLI